MTQVDQMIKKHTILFGFTQVNACFNHECETSSFIISKVVSTTTATWSQHLFILIYAVNQFDQCHYLNLHHSIAYDASGTKVQPHGSVEIENFVMLFISN